MFDIIVPYSYTINYYINIYLYLMRLKKEQQIVLKY